MSDVTNKKEAKMPKLAKIPNVNISEFNSALEKINESEVEKYSFSFEHFDIIKTILSEDEVKKLGKMASVANATQLLFYPETNVHRACFIDNADFGNFEIFVRTRQVQLAYAFFRKSLAPTGSVYFEFSEDFDDLICMPINEAYYSNWENSEESVETITKLLVVLEQFFSYVTYEELCQAVETAHQKIFKEVVAIYGPLKDANGNTLQKFF